MDKTWKKDSQKCFLTFAGRCTQVQSKYKQLFKANFIYFFINVNFAEGLFVARGFSKVSLALTSKAQ